MLGLADVGGALVVGGGGGADDGIGALRPPERWSSEGGDHEDQQDAGD